MKFITAENFDSKTHRWKQPHKSHGLSRTPGYRRWDAMKNRCLSKNCADYSEYGGRGIGICEEWMRFENFFKDMGHPPSKKHLLDRIDNEKGYCKQNCRWADPQVSGLNRRPIKRKYDLPPGVYKNGSKYSAYIRIKKKSNYLGSYESVEEASRVYQNKKSQLIEEGTK
jgi:hypothetical protein